MVRSALYAAIGLVAISSTALAEDLSSATAPLPPGKIHDFSGLMGGSFAGVLNSTEDAHLKNVSTFDVDEQLRD